LKLTFNLHNVP